jgi:hypothetical protein
MKQKRSILSIAFFTLLLVTSLSAGATVYARLEKSGLVTEYHNGYNVSYWTSVSVKFYSNAACTIPATLTTDIDVTVNLEEVDYPTNAPSYSSNTPATITAYTGDSFVGGWYDTYRIYCYDGSTDSVDYNLTLLPGSGYVVVS